MPTTSNFGWTTPADTDLVKDGAAAIRTLGNGIDTSFVDLKGGTTGQVLSKASNTDLDFTWVAQDDSNAIQNAIVDAKGDLITATAADTPARLASSGVNGEVLTVDTSTATGLKWAALPSSTPTFAGCVVWGTGGQTISNATTTTVTFTGTEQFDTDGFYNSGTSTSRMTIPTGKGGYYYFFTNLDFRSGGNTNAVEFRKNGSTIVHRVYQNPAGEAGNRGGSFCSTVLSLAAGDYVEVRVYQNSGGDRTIEKDNDGDTAFGCYLLGV